VIRDRSRAAASSGAALVDALRVLHGPPAGDVVARSGSALAAVDDAARASPNSGRVARCLATADSEADVAAMIPVAAMGAGARSSDGEHAEAGPTRVQSAHESRPARRAAASADAVERERYPFAYPAEVAP